MRYALRLLKALGEHENIHEVHVVISEAGHRVLYEEEDIKLSSANLSEKSLIDGDSGKLIFHNPKDIGASIASGSFQVDGMVIIPCSMSTLGSIAHGIPQNLLHRAADVVLKENKRLILVPRETPLSAIHLENMLKLSRLGVVMLPAMPGFYHKPQTINELIDMQVMKVLDCMGISNDLVKRWGQEPETLRAVWNGR